jgi:membrane-associated protease RseP (regulator of RpoE activity)
MKLKNAFYFAISLLLTGGIALAQQTAPAPPVAPAPDAPPVASAPPDAPPGAFTMFFEGGSFLGVHGENISKENMARYGMREARGVGITQVVKDSPAEKAGLKKDDVIVRFEGDSVTSVRKLTRLVSEVAPDQTVKLGISRGGGEQEVAVTIAKRNESMNAFERLEGLEGLRGLEDLKALKGLDKMKEFHMLPPGENNWKWQGGPGEDGMIFALGNHRRIGATTMHLTKQLADYFGIADGKGVLVTSVGEDTPGAKAGLKAGDVITAIDGEKVEGAGDLARAINKKKEGDVTLTVIRNKSQRTVTVTPKEGPPPPPGGMAPGVRTIVIPRVDLGSIPEINVRVPQIDLPATPEVNVVVPRIKGPRVRVIRAGTEQPI